MTKYYGSVRGIEDLDLEVHEGEVFGFLGPNGAGKTTTIRVLVDLLRPTSGVARVLGHDTRGGSLEIRRRVGYLPGELVLYDDMTPRQLFTFLGALRKTELGNRVAALAKRFDLDVDRKIGELSSGNRQKVGLVQALMHDPEVAILDEPTNALDPLMQQEFYEVLRDMTRRGRTVFLSSHVLPEVERIADRVGIVREGRLVTVATVAELKAMARRRIELHFSQPVDLDRFATLPGVIEARTANEGHVVELVVEGIVDPVIKAAAGYEVTNVISHDGDLEEAFMAFYRGEEPHRVAS